MKEGVSTKMTSTTIHPRRVTSGTAGPLLYDGVGAVGGGTDHWLTAHLATLTAEENTRMNIGQIDGGISALFNNNGLTYKLYIFHEWLPICYHFQRMILHMHTFVSY